MYIFINVPFPIFPFPRGEKSLARGGQGGLPEEVLLSWTSEEG